jgi:hypothetical protein
MNGMNIQQVAAIAVTRSAGSIPAAHPAHAPWAGAASAIERKRHPAAADPSVDWGFI